MTTPSPDPWLVHDKSTLHMNDQRIATVGEHLHVVTHTATEGQTTLTVAANARLIAAAPGLLAACEAAYAYVEFETTGEGSTSTAQGLRSAIAKARGGA